VARYVVTGAAGFIGSNLVKSLNDRGATDIVTVDEEKRGRTPPNLSDCKTAGHEFKDEFLRKLESGAYRGALAAILHQGANSDTTVTKQDEPKVMETNLHYSERLLNYCIAEKVPLIYASSAAIYGNSKQFREGEHEQPLNIYGESKVRFDEVVRRHGKLPVQAVGLRYFNVYGDRESHKGRMASVAFHFFNQYRDAGHVRLFEGSGGYGDGEQRRDFVSVEDCVKVNLHFLDHPGQSGIYNVGTGAAQSFNDVAVATINAMRKARGEAPLTLAEMRASKIIRYIPFPEDLKGRYQSYTQADISALRAAGYSAPFLTVEQGVARYIERLLPAANSRSR
jgi:ADP-L-glycero-D-manno-heptose 6-epimerase